MDGLRLPSNEVPAEKAAELEANAARYWDVFYRNNADRWGRGGPLDLAGEPRRRMRL
jgi:hypothetical protein